MRYIIKGIPDRLLMAKHNNPGTAFLTPVTARSAWGGFRGIKKKRTKVKCINEQYGLCGYSEVEIDNVIINNQLIGMHLEHVIPKSLEPSRTFDHYNLIASSFSSDAQKIVAKKDIFGGHAKLSWYSYNAFIGPLNPKCRDYFHYESSTGKVVPSKQLSRREQAKARITIYKLNLNSPVLVNLRKTWLQETENIINDLLDDVDALRHFASVELCPTNGKLRSFHSAQRQLFGAIGDEVLKGYPEI